MMLKIALKMTGVVDQKEHVPILKVILLFVKYLQQSHLVFQKLTEILEM